MKRLRHIPTDLEPLRGPLPPSYRVAMVMTHDRNSWTVWTLHHPHHSPQFRRIYRFIPTVVYRYTDIGLRQCAHGTRRTSRRRTTLRTKSSVDIIDRVIFARTACRMIRRQWPPTTLAFTCRLHLYVLPSNYPASSPYRYISHGIIRVYR